MSQQMENTIFYSKFCRHCKDFIVLLKKENLLDVFTQRICIDGKKNLPPFLKEVPTIIISDFDEPLASDRAFNWVEFKKTKKAEVAQKESGIESFDDTGGLFDDNFGVLDNGDNSTAYQGLGSENSMKKDGNSMVQYQESLLPKELLSAAKDTGGGGDIAKRLEARENMRALDNKMMKQ